MPQSLRLTNVTLQCGITLPIAELVYEIHGQLNADRSNAILYPTSYGAQHPDVSWLIRTDSILDPDRYCIIQVNLLGNGLSTSPSQTEPWGATERGSWFTHWDNVQLQAHLIFEVLQIKRLALVYGWSMGAQVAYHWGALYPDRVDRLAVLCGTARTTEHNRIFLQSLRLALTGDPAWVGDRFEQLPERGLRTFARIYASWAASQGFYRDRLYRPLGYHSLEDYLLRGWEANYRKRDPHHLLAMLDTWLHCDLGDNPLYCGDYQAAMAAIQAPVLVMPGTTDLYFTPEDCKAEADLLARSQYRPIPSLWGHRAGNPSQNPDDECFIRDSLRDFLYDGG